MQSVRPGNYWWNEKTKSLTQSLIFVSSLCGGAPIVRVISSKEVPANVARPWPKSFKRF